LPTLASMNRHAKARLNSYKLKNLNICSLMISSVQETPYVLPSLQEKFARLMLLY
jgi:hypothetical protein